ncbi:MAG TPA: NADPH-dependent FMN reductase [Candidatus Limnocylindria bacterium]|nr:NADPH-dependent FMN reductase [Candidatus Limnocylindria bacterium]
MLNIPVILGSVREGRSSENPAKFLVEKIKAAGHTSELVDFKQMPLPFFNSALMPVELKGKYPEPNIQKWSEIAYNADAFVIVTPEYNHGYPGVLKNALDWLYLEFDHKPVGLVGVSDGLVAGARVIEQLRPIMENFSMFAVRETVMFAKAPEVFDKDGKLLDPVYEKKVDGMLKSLVSVAEIMKVYPRAKRP